jgi:hypothetical protein
VIGNTFLGNCASGPNLSGVMLDSGGGIYAYGLPVVANNLVAFGNSGILSYGSGVPMFNNCVYGNATDYLMPDPTGTNGNISVDPLLLATNDYHLASNSPCINAGNNAYVTSSTDFDGNPRIAGGTVDIGACEFQNPASLLSYAWLQQYGLPTDGQADFIDTDADGMNNWQEWRAGTIPTNSASSLRMLTATNDASGTTVTWQSVSGVRYSIQRSDLTDCHAFSTIQTNIAGLAGTTSFADTNTLGAPCLFYRACVP